MNLLKQLVRTRTDINLWASELTYCSIVHAMLNQLQTSLRANIASHSNDKNCHLAAIKKLNRLYKSDQTTIYNISYVKLCTYFALYTYIIG